MDLATQLRIKYGLAPEEPRFGQVDEWIERTAAYIDGGDDAETAGQKAAAEVFKTYRTCRYYSQASNVTDLLNALGNAGGKSQSS